MEHAANDDKPHKIEEDDYIDKDNHQFESTDKGVLDTESTGGVPQE